MPLELHQFVLLSQLLPMLQVVVRLEPQKLEVKSYEVLGLHFSAIGIAVDISTIRFTVYDLAKDSQTSAEKKN